MKIFRTATEKNKERKHPLSFRLWLYKDFKGYKKTSKNVFKRSCSPTLIAFLHLSVDIQREKNQHFMLMLSVHFAKEHLTNV